MDEIWKITCTTVAKLPDSSALADCSLKCQHFPSCCCCAGVDSAQLEIRAWKIQHKTINSRYDWDFYFFKFTWVFTSTFLGAENQIFWLRRCIIRYPLLISDEYGSVLFEVYIIKMCYFFMKEYVWFLN